MDTITKAFQAPEETAEFIMNLYHQFGGEDYIGEPVSQLEHMCQCAALAEKEGFDEEVILAAFFHDIGHFCEHIMPVKQMNGYGVVDHEKLGAVFLRSKGFSEKIASLVENHVQAKRYLTYHYPEYYQQLSEASKKTLEFQGGRMTLEEAMAFERDPLFDLHLKLRKWDEKAKLEHQPVPSLEKYADMILQQLKKLTMTVKLAVFDIAGTTVGDDSAVANAFCHAFETYGYEVMEDDVKPLMGYKKPLAIRMALEKLGVDWDMELIDNIHDEFVGEMLDYYEYSPEVRPMMQAEDVFLQLKERGIRVALNTGFSKDIADVIVNRFQWKEKGLIDDYIASDEVEEGRPQPFMIQTLMERSGVDDPKEVVKVGDTEVDINEGRNAGCALVVAVTTGAFTREQLNAYHPDHIIDDLSQLPALIF